MKISHKQKTTPINFELSDLGDRVFIKARRGEIWISTNFGEITVGVVGGKMYILTTDGELIDVEKKIGD